MPQNVYTLLCERDLAMALITVPTMIKFMEPDQQFVIVDDGTFSESTIAALSAISPQIKIITRKQREEFILDIIKDYPNCIAYRNKFPLAFKLIDIPLLAKRDSQRFTYTDADILYYKNCEPYFNRVVNTYLRTDGIKISVKLQHVLFKYKWDLPYQFNSGYFSFDTAAYDLDFVEYFLGLPDINNIVWLSEQTCWALIFAKAGASYCPDTNQFICRHPYDGPHGGVLALHMIGLKHMVNEWAPKAELLDIPADQPVFAPSRNVSVLDWVQKNLKQMLNIK